MEDWIDQPKYLTSSQLLELEQAGFAIQNHSKTHPHLSQLSLSEQDQELLTAKNKLEDLLKQDITSIATPYGNHNADTLSVAQSLKTDLLFTGQTGIPSSELSDPYQLPRISLLQSHSFEEFLDFLLNY
ncbi:polysaccharide deacetylase family protein [Streptococcus ovuberis]|uniref:Polysaccharide deacetylase family protein n=1 Tax=Streptococcus ovuberis TaxID=1936207 RepID=A0A7X6MWL2_9STRE|nr:polysaccharide deacetylase family protein [Streptococcus ovuberis]NKZ19735.1 polysaccharide deacetylase family protein [Streptococcus ovuberis]